MTQVRKLKQYARDLFGDEGMEEISRLTKLNNLNIRILDRENLTIEDTEKYKLIKYKDTELIFDKIANKYYSSSMLKYYVTREEPYIRMLTREEIECFKEHVEGHSEEPSNENSNEHSNADS